MAYKWKPSKTAKREFAIKMQDPDFAHRYNKRKEERAEKRRSGSSFDYEKAGGFFIPTKFQSDSAMNFLHSKDLTNEQIDACSSVIYGFTCNEKVHHDYIHVVNELIRTKE